MKKPPTLHATGVHRLPEDPSNWHLNSEAVVRARSGIALAREALTRATANQPHAAGSLGEDRAAAA